MSGPLPDPNSLASRLALLSIDARALLETAAVFESACYLADLAEASGLTEERFRAAIGELLDRGLLRDSDETGLGYCEFASEAERRTVYRSLPWLRRRQLDRRVRDVLFGDSPAKRRAMWLATIVVAVSAYFLSRSCQPAAAQSPTLQAPAPRSPRVCRMGSSLVVDRHLALQVVHEVAAPNPRSQLTGH